MAFEVGSVIARIKADITDFEDGMNRAQARVNGFSSTLKNVGSGIAEFGKQAAVFTGIVAAGLTVIGKNALDSASDMEQNATAFRTMLGNADTAAKLLKDISNFARSTPFTLPQVVDGSKQLLAYGFSAEKVIDVTRMLGDVSAGLKVPLNDMVYLYGTLRAQGKAYTKDLNQFMNRGIPVVEELAKKFHTTTEAILEMTEKGQISFKDVEEVFKKLTGEGGKFHNMMAEQATTLGGVFSNIQDGITRAALAFFGWNEETAKFNNGSIFQTIKGFSVELQKFVENVGPMLGQMGQMVVNVFGNLAKFLEPLGKWVSEHQELVITFLQGLAIGIGALLIIGTVTTLVMALINPLTLLVIAIGALYTAWQTNFWGIRDVTQSVITEAISFFNEYLQPSIQAFMEWWNQAWPAISLTLQGAWEIMLGVTKLLWNLIYMIIKVGLAMLTGDWVAFWDALAVFQQKGWEAIKQIFVGIISFMVGWGATVISTLVSPFDEAWKRISDIVSRIKDALDFTKRHSPSVVDIVQKGVKLVNQSLEGLAVTPQISTATMGSGILAGAGAVGGGVFNIQVDLGGAVIADDFSATRIGEMIGNNIIKKLQTNVRF